ncbi:MAG: hypothetical protein BRC29_00160 [Nanohaloarchaea archaeon SW_7_43_1]|nr:MAG: hypothetical protein BRC29_00160 [Nanohaloarchaea archaeon SW_7_43_1]
MMAILCIDMSPETEKEFEALDDPKVRNAMADVLEESKEGLIRLKNEEYSKKRRNETIVGKAIRIVKSKLFGRSKSQAIELSR